jgi:putative restriction endonuclease
MRAKGRNWTESEVMQVIDLYVTTPFGKMHSKNPEVIAMANKLERTSGSIALKMANLARLRTC